MGNVIGEEFEDYVAGQINVRANKLSKLKNRMGKVSIRN